MKKLMVALGLLGSLSAGCTVPTVEDLTGDLAGHLKVDKETVLAYTESAMKQAALSASAITAEARGTTTPAAAPKKVAAYRAKAFSKLAVTQSQCMQVSDFLCNEEGTLCQYTEDYKGCGKDFQGKITRKFEGDFETYKVTVEFEGYAEKASDDANHYAFTGKSIMTGTIGISSANLSMHSEGLIGSNIGGTYFKIQNSSDTTFTYLNGELSINGTQSGKVEGTDQTTSISITELKFDGKCETGPVSGTVKTTIGGKESLTTVASCGNATLTVDGEAVPVSSEEVASTFVPEAGIGGEKGFESIVEGTEAGALLSGSWYRETADSHEWVNIYEYDGITYVDRYSEQDVDANQTFSSVGDTFSGGFGTLVVDGGTITPTWEYKFSGVWSFDDQTSSYFQDFTQEQYGVTDSPITFTLEGNNRLFLNGLEYTNLAGEVGGKPGDVNEPMPEMSSFALNGSWIYDSGTTLEYWSFYEDSAGYTNLYYDKSVDVDTDASYGGPGDTYEWRYGEFTHDDIGMTFTPMWYYAELTTYGDGVSTPNNYSVIYDSNDNAGAPQTDTPREFTVTTPGVEITINGITFTPY